MCRRLQKFLALQVIGRSPRSWRADRLLQTISEAHSPLELLQSIPELLQSIPGSWFFAKQRQLQWAHAAEELWECGRHPEAQAFGLDGASGGFQGLVHDGDVVYVVGVGSLQRIDYFHGKHPMTSRHGVAALVPWCQMINEDEYPSYMLVSQKGRFAHALVLIQQEFRTKRFLRALKALRLLPEASADILYSIAHLCSGRALRNGIRYPVENL